MRLLRVLAVGLALLGCGQSPYTAESVRPRDICSHEKLSEAECAPLESLFGRDQELWKLLAPVIADYMNGAPHEQIVPRVQEAMVRYMDENAELIRAGPSDALNDYSSAMEKVSLQLRDMDPTLCAKWLNEGLSDPRVLPPESQESLLQLGVAAVAAISASRQSPTEYPALNDEDMDTLWRELRMRGYSQSQIESYGSPDASDTLTCAMTTSLLEIVNGLPEQERAKFISELFA